MPTPILPAWWKQTTLGEVAEIIPWFAFKSKDFWLEWVPVVKITEINPPYVDFSNSQYVDISQYDLEKLKRYELNKWDAVVAMTGATIGKTWKIITDNKSYLNQRVAKITNVEWKSDKRFIYFTISSNFFTSYVEKFAFWAVQANISGTEIGKFPLSLPPLPEQKAIAQVLGSLDDSSYSDKRTLRSRLSVRQFSRSGSDSIALIVPRSFWKDGKWGSWKTCLIFWNDRELEIDNIPRNEQGL